MLKAQNMEEDVVHDGFVTSSLKTCKLKALASSVEYCMQL